MSVIKGKLGDVYMALLPAVALTNPEPMTCMNDSTKTIYVVTDQHHRFLDPDTALVVKDGVDTVTDYTVQYPGGIITFADATSGAITITSGKYLTVAKVGECSAWSLDFSTDFVDITSFGDSFRRQIAMMSNASANMTHFYVDNTLFDQMISINPRLGIDLFVDTTADAVYPFTKPIRYTGYGTLGSASITADVGGIVEQPFVVNFNDGPYYTVGLPEELA